MDEFRLDSNIAQDLVRRAQRRAQSPSAASVIEIARRGDGLSPEEMATLWCTSQLDAKSIYQLARAARRRRPSQLETFAPLYLTNTCDAECRMCGMRRDNRILKRQTAAIAAVEDQLRILSQRGMRAVALLTGEYRAAKRPWALQYVNQALRITQELEFAHVLINVGSVDDGEFDTLLDGIARNDDGSVRPKLTMCTFQETYSTRRYAKFIGTDPTNPRADFPRRLANFDRAFRAGIRVANPGILLGLNPNVAYELTALALHAQHLLALGMQVYVSVPRLRQVAGGRSQGGISDGDFIRLVALLSLGLPMCKIVITTREPATIQQTLAPIVSVISAGSAAVTPYTDTGARFPLEASQFEVIDQRPFEQILAEYVPSDGAIENYYPQSELSA